MRIQRETMSWWVVAAGILAAAWIVTSSKAQVNLGCGVSAGPCAVILTVPTTVANLPACTAANDGARAFVTDQLTAAAYRGAVTGTGAQHQAVLCASAAWIQD